jgi:uncharacterized protein (DUF433 family)
MPRIRKTELTVDEVVAWAMWRTGAPVKEIANKFGLKTRQAIYHRAKKVEKALAEKIDLGKLKNACLLCYPLALESLQANLKKHDVSMTQFFLKHWLELSDKIEGEGFASSAPIFIIQSNHNQPKTEDKPQDVSKRFCLEQS